MTPPLIKCACCDGMGKTKLHPDYWRTLQRVRKAKHPVGTLDLLESGVTSNAINNRLKRIEEFGLIRRAGKNGKFILWEAVKP